MTFWAGRTILVTGGTGTWGRAFSRRILQEPIRKLIILSRDEAKQEVHARDFPDERVRMLLGDVRDPDALHHAFRGVNVVFHAAALKRVPAIEYAPMEGLKTNVIGAANVVNAAIDNHVERVIALSSDKASAPLNFYGKTKAVAESLFVHGNSLSGGTGTTFSVVRYGNVIGSRGSVAPLFQSQRASGTLTITDPAMTRFVLTIGDAVEFTMSSLEAMQGGEIFIPKCPSVRITDIAWAVAPECEYRVIGPRPGEKTHESLISRDESPYALPGPSQYVIHPLAPPSAETFAYASDTNDQWLDAEGFAALLPRAMAEAG